MYIFDNIRAEKTREDVWLYIDKPKEFMGLPDQPNKSDVNSANRGGWSPDTPEDYTPDEVQKTGFASEMDERAGFLDQLLNSPSYTNPVVLADDEYMLRGYGAGLAFVTFLKNPQGTTTPRIYLPQRDAGAPGDRLVWDTCSGRTMYKGEDKSWFDRMIKEGVEELVFGLDGIGLSYKFDLNSRINLTFDPYSITKENLRGLGISQRDFVGVEIIKPANGAEVIQTLPNGEAIQFQALPIIESKFSGLELVAYAHLNLPSYTDEKDLKVWDGERLPDGTYLNREIHELDLWTDRIRVFQNGRVIRKSTVSEELDLRTRRMWQAITKDPESKKRFPMYNSTAKAVAVTRQKALPDKLRRSDHLSKLKFG